MALSRSMPWFHTACRSMPSKAVKMPCASGLSSSRVSVPRKTACPPTKPTLTCSPTKSAPVTARMRRTPSNGVTTSYSANSFRQFPTSRPRTTSGCSPMNNASPFPAATTASTSSASNAKAFNANGMLGRQTTRFRGHKGQDHRGERPGCLSRMQFIEMGSGLNFEKRSRA